MDMIKSYLLNKQKSFSIHENISREDFGSFIDKTCFNSFDIECPESWKGKNHYKNLKRLLKKEAMGTFAFQFESFVVDKNFVFH